MPNWCSNTITIEGSKPMIDRFKELSLNVNSMYGEDLVFSFNPTVPSPSEVDGNWCSENWGTKWDANGPMIILETDKKVIIQCDTAWAPPIAWAKKCVTPINNLKITIAYCECGVAFYGVTTITPGNVNRDDHHHDMGDDLGYDDEIDEYVITGKLKEFMNKYQIRSLGG